MANMRLPKVMIVMVIMMPIFFSYVMSAIPGPKDPRYPDEIVMPKVKCESEGVFPHPRNCSWYYRCVDRMNVGYFWTYHFECEPGTVFSDELDQCIFPFLTGPPCGTAGSASPSPVTPATLPDTPLPLTPTQTATPTQRPDNGTHGPLVPEPEPTTQGPTIPEAEPTTQVPTIPEAEPTTQVPTIPEAESTTLTETKPPATESPITTPEENPTTIEEEAETTETYTTVPVEPETTTATLIEADPTTTSAPIVQPETTELPSTTSAATVQPETPEPTTEPAIDFPSEIPTLTQPATTVITFEETTTMEPTTISSTNVGIFSCTFRPQDCVTHGPCPPDTITRTLCTGCYILGTFVEASNLCNQEQGKLYDKDNRVCISDPALNPDCFPEPTTTTTIPEPTTTAPLVTVAITTEFDITCSAETTRPQEDWVLNRYCQYYYLCTSDGLFTGAVRLCDNYYQCYLGADNRWATELMSCPEGQLFSYDQDKCVNAPSDQEICAFRVREG